MHNKKVAIIGNSLSPHVLNRLFLLRDAKNVSFLLFDTNLNSEIDIPIPRIPNTIPKILFIPKIGYLLKLFRSLLGLLYAKPDVIFIMYCSKLSLLYSIFFKGKVILSFWGGDLLNRTDKKRGYILKSIQKRAILKADKVYCVSKELIEEAYNVTDNKLIKAPCLLMYGLDLNLYTFSSNEMKQQNEYFTIYSPRWCLPIYNIEVIVDAVILLLKAGEKVRLIYRDVYIDESDEAVQYSVMLANKIKHLDFRSNFQVVGLVEKYELIKIIQSSDVVISVSHFDGTPLSILEAMACKTLTVSGKIPSTTNFIVHGVNGYLVDKDSPEELAQQLKYIIRHRNEQSNIIESARLYVETYANIDREVAEYVKVINEI
jgi:glycosyltransferase involved in cell wall biosynthesis